MTDTPVRRPRTPKVATASVPAAAPEPAPQVAEVAQVTTRYAHPVYVASQHKLIRPGEVCPIIVDDWVRHQLGHWQGSLIKA